MAQAILNREQSRRIDELATQQFGMNSLVLMENAGRSLATLLKRVGGGGKTIICCGKGNNAGDGFVMARHLCNRGGDVRVLLWDAPDALQGDAATNFAILQHCNVAIERVERVTDEVEDQMQGAGWLVDALLGTGAAGPPRPPYDEAIRAMNASGSKILAVDVPSGLDCDTGQPNEPCIRALHTGTFATTKTGFQQPGAARYTGNVHVLDIGVPRGIVDRL